MYTLDNFFLNIRDNYKFVKEDFIGFSISITGIISFLTIVLVSLAVIFVLYLLGRRTRLFLFKHQTVGGLEYLISIGLGHIVVGIGIAALGILSVLYTEVIAIYLSFLALIAFYPFGITRVFAEEILNKIKESYQLLKPKKWLAIGIFAFILISFLRLIPPEIGEDAIGYHTDLPTFYLKNHTMLIENINSKNILQVIPAPQLGETLYLIVIFLNSKDASRYIHFIFYVFVVYLIYTLFKNKVNGLYAAIIFITAPVVIRHASKANVDFQALFFWLLAVFLFTRGKIISKTSVILSGIFFGAALSTKLWEIAFFPIFILYIFLTQRDKLVALKLILLFTMFAFLTSGIWYIRAYILTGNPVFPALEYDISHSNLNIFERFPYIGINLQMFSYSNLVGYSPLFYLGIIFSLFSLSHVIRKLRDMSVFLFFILLSLEHLFIQYYLPRYLLNLYSISALMVSVGISKFTLTSMGKYVFGVIFLVLFFYYFLNTLLVLPYAFGWADENKYLTRILSRDSSSYYDYDRLFDKHFSKKDLVAVYSLSGFYYAKFSHIDAGYIFDEKNKNFNLLRIKGINKLLIRGGEIGWFCKKLQLINCDKNMYKLIASYQPKPLYLYSINAK